MRLHRTCASDPLSRPYPRMDWALADAVGLCVHERLPERCRTDGSRVHKRRGPQPKEFNDKDRRNARERDSDLHPRRHDKQAL